MEGESETVYMYCGGCGNPILFGERSWQLEEETVCETCAKAYGVKVAPRVQTKEKQKAADARMSAFLRMQNENLERAKANKTGMFAERKES